MLNRTLTFQTSFFQWNGTDIVHADKGTEKFISELLGIRYGLHFNQESNEERDDRIIPKNIVDLRTSNLMRLTSLITSQRHSNVLRLNKVYLDLLKTKGFLTFFMGGLKG